MTTAWEPVIGLEIHVQLKTETKMFCRCRNGFGGEPNSQTCPVCLAFPGALPVPNRRAIEETIELGLALDCTIAERAVFHRKNYFYPDNPKAYQISQYDEPLCAKGHLDLPTEEGVTRIGITRAHLEEDAGKSLHEGLPGLTGIDLNRAGTPLEKIVSEPEMRSAKEAVAYMKKVHTLVRYLRICDGNMQEGSFRCDANVSVRPRGADKFGTRAEIKNINSFRYVEKAINFEVGRQIELLESGGKVVQETRLFDPDRGETRSMRSKEEANDYRYFPDPDLLPVEIDQAYIDAVRAQLPELPDEKANRFTTQYQLSGYDAQVLTASSELAHYYESVVREFGGSPKLAANWVGGDLAAFLNRDGLEITASRVSAGALAVLLRRIDDRTISGKIAKDVFAAMWDEQLEADAIIAARGLRQITDEGSIEQAIAKVLAAHPGQLADYRSGKDKLFGFFVGQVMKATQGKANPERLNQLLKKALSG